MIFLTAQDAGGVVLNILAFAGLAAFLMFRADARRNSPLEARLFAVFSLLLALVGVRTLHWAFQIDVLQRPEEALAAALPLGALVLAEGLQRRHAPGVLKRFFLGGGLLLALVALVRPASLDLPFMIAQGAFVAGGLFCVAVLLTLRDRKSLAPTENAAIGALGLDLAAALPCVASDFLYAAGGSPVRAGGLGLLIVVYAAARLSSAGADGRGVLSDLLLAGLSALVAFVTFVAVLGAPPLMTGLAFLTIILGLVLVILIVQALREQDMSRRQAVLLTALAAAPEGPLDAFLDAVLDIPALKSAVVLEEAALSDYDGASLRSVLSASPAASLPELKSLGRPGEPLAALIEAHEGTHAVLLSDRPLRLLCVTMPELGTGPTVQLHLQLLQKLAWAAAHTP